MSDVVETDEQGSLHLSSQLLGGAQPHARYEVRHAGDQLILRPAQSQEAPFWQTATPRERAEAFRRWAESHTDGPGLSDEAISRDSIYD